MGDVGGVGGGGSLPAFSKFSISIDMAQYAETIEKHRRPIPRGLWLGLAAVPLPLATVSESPTSCWCPFWPVAGGARAGRKDGADPTLPGNWRDGLPDDGSDPTLPGSWHDGLRGGGPDSTLARCWNDGFGCGGHGVVADGQRARWRRWFGVLRVSFWPVSRCSG